MLESSDSELMAAIVSGDEQAFQTLSLRYVKMLFSAAYRFGFSKEDAEDIVQDIMLKVWNRPESWDPKRGACVKTWLYRMAYNRAIDLKRKYKVTVPVEEENLSISSGVEGEIDAQRQSAAMRKAISALPARQKMALVLSYYEGLSHAQTAQVMKATPKAVEGLIARARQVLKMHYINNQKGQ